MNLCRVLCLKNIVIVIRQILFLANKGELIMFQLIKNRLQREFYQYLYLDTGLF